MRVLVCGDRDWGDRDTMVLVFSQLPWKKVDVIIHGDCRGADRLAGAVAEQYGKKVEKFPAEWKAHGRAAGPIRNQKMLDEGKPDLVLAFHPNLAKSKGTADMVRRARKAGVRVVVIGSEGRRMPSVA